MAQHDFVPAWLNFSTPQVAKSSAPLERHEDHRARGAARPGLSRRRHNSSDGFFNNDPRRASAGDGWSQPALLRHDSVDSSVAEGELGGLGSRKTVTWAQERPHRGCQPKRPAGERDRERTGAQRQRNGTAHARKGGPLPSEGGHKDKLKFAEEDFPSLNPESCGKLMVQPRAVGTPVGVWEHPPSAKQTMTKMLVIKKVSKDDAGTAFSASFANTGPHITNGTKTPVSGSSVYKNLVPKPATTTPSKTGSWKPNGRENKTSFNFSGQESAFTSPAASVNKPLIIPVTPPTQVSNHGPTRVSPKEPPSSITPPIDVTPPIDMTPSRLKLMRRSTDRKSDFLRGLKDEKNGDESITTSPSTTPDIRKDGEEVQRNGITHSVSDTDHLSISLEAEHRLLKAMGWQEYPENDDNFLPLTDDELREFQAKTEKLKRNRLCQNGVLPKPLLKTTPPLLSWRNPVEPELEEVSETEGSSSSQTSDDDADT